MTKLERMLKYVSEHNDFYKRRIKEYGITNPLDITQWPILTRKELQENRYNMFSDGYKTKYYDQQLRRQASSGSSGIPVTVYWDYKDWYASNMALWRERRRWYKVSPLDRCVMFTLNAFNISEGNRSLFYFRETDNVLNINISMIQNDNDYAELLYVIEDFAPIWIYIQPFVLKKLLKAYRQTRKIFLPSVKYIECVGEILEDSLKRDAHSFFATPIANMYGSEEMNGIGFEPFNHKMHIFSDNVYVETKNINGIFNSGDGEAIITNLNNKAMPLIRYNQGDIISIARPICPSTGGMHAAIRINGRSFEIIKINEKIEINPLMLLETMAEAINEYGDIITSYRYVFYKSKNELQCIITIDDNKKQWYPNIKASIVALFEQKAALNNSVLFTVSMSDAAIFDNGKQKVIDIIE